MNTKTAPRALRQLRDEGLLEFPSRTRSHRSGTPERGAVVARARELVEFARHQASRPESSAASSKTSPDARLVPSAHRFERIAPTLGSRGVLPWLTRRRVEIPTG